MATSLAQAAKKRRAAAARKNPNGLSTRANDKFRRGAQAEFKRSGNLNNAVRAGLAARAGANKTRAAKGKAGSQGNS